MRVTGDQLRKIVKKVLLTEEVFGAQAFVYHGSRMKPDEFIPLLLSDSFDPGRGAGSLYGKGLYTVYDLPGSATDNGMYGPFVYKLKINLYGFISFDKKITNLIYKKEITPAEQAKMLGLDAPTIKFLEMFVRDERWTSDSAKAVNAYLKGKVKGIIFTGRQDGRVAVIYDASVALPVSWRERGSREFIPVDRNLLRGAAERTASDRWKEARYETPKEVPSVSKYAPKTWQAMITVARDMALPFDYVKEITEYLNEHVKWLGLDTKEAKLDRLFVTGEKYLIPYYKDNPNPPKSAYRDWNLEIRIMWTDMLENNLDDEQLFDIAKVEYGSDVETRYVIDVRKELAKELTEETAAKMRSI